MCVSLLQRLQQRTKCTHLVPDRSIMELFEIRRSGTSFCDSRVADQHEANAPNGTINYVEDNKRRCNTIKTCKQIRLTSGL